MVKHTMLDEIRQDRLKKLKKLEEAGVNPYPANVSKHIEIADALRDFAKLMRSGKPVYLAGRIMSLRDQGGLLFIDINDGSGVIQIFANKKEVKQFALWKESLDPGDFIGVKGVLFKTKRGERSIKAAKIDVLVKSLNPLPDSWFGLKDVEERFRKRYLDLILNKEVKETFEMRSLLIRQMREFLWKEGFIEVETPMLQPIPGGALARPFKTHHNALGEDFYLRIAPELYLKRLLVGGFNKIFEIGRVFRNEGIDREHNPEFTMLELYWAYEDYEAMIKLTEKLLKPFIKGPWRRVKYADAFKQYAKVDINKIKDKEEIDEIFKRKVRPHLQSPTILVDQPKATSPLAKSKANDPDVTERFHFIVESMEVANGFSELNDPIDQRQRMEYQEKLFRKGNEEASRMDEEFVEALEYGMPPAAGLGVGIDRIVALATKRHSLKEAILFPTLKSKK
ncbi:MAG: lysine--tRNA ligase [Candidatus Colwellbacteria bacterium]|nr:lysine--tRNA ligase [Candidatus Colwellbacteria bacterium]